MPKLETITTIDLTTVTGGFGISDLMGGSWDRQADASLNAGKDSSASTSAGAGKSSGTFSGGLRNLLSGFTGAGKLN